MALNVTRDESEETGYHYRQDFEDGAVEVDAFRIHSEGELFLEVFGSRGSDSQPDSVVIALPAGSAIYSLAQALTRGNVFLDKLRRERARKPEGQ